MLNSPPRSDYDAAIVGGGPAGLSAALVLGRACRRVTLFDHARPRNAAAQAVHGYLGRDGVAPAELRELGRREARRYGVEVVDEEVLEVVSEEDARDGVCAFYVRTAQRQVRARRLLLATGMIDVLPDVENLADFYGRSVHHCPYCDGWEHRGQHLVAFGEGTAAAKLALTLRTWSPRVTACTHGRPLDDETRPRLERHGIGWREETVLRLEGDRGVLKRVVFASGPPLVCDSLFFSAGQAQRSPLPVKLGCKIDAKGRTETGFRQATGVGGVYLAGDADGDVQFAIVAAAEGAIAATAINRELQEEDERLVDDQTPLCPTRRQNV